MPLLGRAGDVYGYRRLYLGAMLLFGVGSAAVALAPNLGWLIAARVVQAVGGGALVPAAIALAGEGLPPARRAVVFGIVGAAAEAGGVLGPLYGGLIVDWIGWRWVFWSNLPIVAVLAVALLGMPEAGALRRAAGRYRRCAARGRAVVGDRRSRAALAVRRRLSPAVRPHRIGVLLLVALPFAERRALAPVVSTALFRARSFAAAMSAQLLAGGALVLILVTVPLMTDTVLGEPPLEGGLRLMRFTGAIPVGALLGGYAASRIDVRVPALVGLALAAVCFVLLTTWDETIADPRLTLHLAIGGLGFGLLIAPFTVAAVEAAGNEYRATAAAWITASRMFGMTAGLAAMSALGVDYLQSLAGGLPVPIQLPGESAAAFSERVAVYEEGISNASFDVFRLFFRSGLVLVILAAAPSLWMRGARRG